MLLEDAHNSLGWPSPKQVLDPVGSGARIYADFAKQKIGEALRRKFKNLQVETGVLAADPNSGSTEAPIAVVCQFPSGANAEILDFAHKLAWNFSRTALLITLEPHRLIAWSCCQNPNEPLGQRLVCELLTSPSASLTGTAVQQSVRDLLHWVSLITGSLLKQQQIKFPADGRADALLLKNLKYIRHELLKDGLPEKYCHDLLARVIFTQFLFHRKDSDGRPFFDKPLLDGKCEGRLHRIHDDLPSILADKSETYALFRWLDEKFNGDLFPGKEDQTEAQRKQAWKEEETAVTETRLGLLADFVSGKLDAKDKQLALWPQYSFDTIPLEFISSVYEEFLNEEKLRDKAYYTPAHLVDFILDAVLPWDAEEWNLKVLDASCGSGIFLVKAFQRLIYRWRRKNKGKDPLVSDLKPILANNFIGVDKNEEAVRVACFSLYLAMADAIEPKYYLKREKVFPPLRGERLIAQDFFDESTSGYRTKEDAGSFDLVIGNAPWGARSVKSSSDPAAAKGGEQKKLNPTKAEQWAENYEWPIANHDIGPLFLAKALKLVKPDGRVAMVQPASTLLYLRSGQALKLRQKLFTEFTADEVANLSALRWELFPEAVGPSCIIVCSTHKPSPTDECLYFYPKPLLNEESGYRFIIEPQDVNTLTHSEAANEPIIWSALALGGRRDFLLAKRLSKFPTFGKLQETGDVVARKGIVRGRQGRQKRQDELLDKPILETTAFPKDHPNELLHELDAQQLPPNKDPLIEEAAAVDLEPFKMPQFIVKKSWPVQQRHFEATIVKSIDKEWGAICTQSYVTVHDRKTSGQIFRGAWLTYNSRLAFYLLALKSSRLGHYRPEPLLAEFLDLPLPKDFSASLRSITTSAEIDDSVRKIFVIRESEWALVEDLTDITFLDVTSSTHSIARKDTARSHEPASSQSEPELYAQTFVRVVRATFGGNKSVSATVFEEPTGEKLPVRMVAIHLDWPGHQSIAVETMRADALMDELKKLYSNSLANRKRAASGNGIGFQRVAFLFHSHNEAHGRVRSLYIIKPDQRRYWTRSLAMRDADQLSVAILKAVGRKNSNT